MRLMLVPVRTGSGHRVCLSPTHLAPARHDRRGELRLSEMPSSRWTAVAHRGLLGVLCRARWWLRSDCPGHPGVGEKLPGHRLRGSITNCAARPGVMDYGPCPEQR